MLSDCGIQANPEEFEDEHWLNLNGKRCSDIECPVAVKTRRSSGQNTTTTEFFETPNQTLSAFGDKVRFNLSLSEYNNCLETGQKDFKLLRKFTCNR